MNDESQTEGRDSSDDSRDEGDRLVPAQADRPPTTEESAAADRAAGDVDLDEVGEHFTEMTELGKNVKGEGEIVPN